MNLSKIPLAVTLLALTPALFCQDASAQGIVAPGAGSVHRSFGGTAIAAPLDAIGALYWNPATLSFLGRRIDIASELFWKNQTVESTIPANLLGPGTPPTPVTGKTRSQDGLQLGPATALVLRFDQKPWNNLTFSFGAFPYSGGGSNYPADPNNPTLAGLGGWFNSFVVLTFPLAVSYKVRDNVSVALAVDFAAVTWLWSRAIFASPNAATVNGRTVTQYAPAIANSSYGIGVHIGAYYHSANGLGLGVMVKSPIFLQWLDYNTTTIAGAERTVSVKINTPLFFGAGVSYDGVEKWLFALDLKYAIYEGTTGYYADDEFFQPNGRVHGLGYGNGLAITSGIQYKPSDRWSTRIGYKYSTRIVPDRPTFELTSSSLRHAVGGGASYDLVKAIALHAGFVLSWAIPIENAMTSPLNNQPIPGTNLRLTLVEYTPSIGISFKF
jgi:long-chain fatty acid transport protein